MDQRPKSFSFARAGKLLFISVAVLYVILCIMMATLQRRFLYFPRVFNSTEVNQMAQSANLQRWTGLSGNNIGFKRLSTVQPSLGSILIMYGNGSTAIDSAHYAGDLQGVVALDVYILEYPGYEDRPGKPTEKNLFAAGDEAIQALPANKPIYLLGESLGSGVASYLAGKYTNQISGVILISPFNSVTAVAKYHYPILPVSLLLTDRFPSDEYLRNYHGKVGITVAGRDVVVPEQFGRRLYDGYAGPKKLWEFPEGGHCEIAGSPEAFWREVIQFWQKD